MITPKRLFVLHLWMMLDASRREDQVLNLHPLFINARHPMLWRHALASFTARLDRTDIHHSNVV